MSNVYPINESIGILYTTDDQGNPGIGHEDWPCDLVKMGDDVVIIAKDSGEILEKMPADQFNSIAYFWLLLDAPELFNDLIKR